MPPKQRPSTYLQSTTAPAQPVGDAGMVHLEADAEEDAVADPDYSSEEEGVDFADAADQHAAHSAFDDQTRAKIYTLVCARLDYDQAGFTRKETLKKGREGVGHFYRFQLNKNCKILSGWLS